jgi:hypothetical protein
MKEEDIIDLEQDSDGIFKEVKNPKKVSKPLRPVVRASRQDPHSPLRAYRLNRDAMGPVQIRKQFVGHIAGPAEEFLDGLERGLDFVERFAGALGSRRRR